MLQRSGEALYSSCASDKPRTCSATICVVISKCTRRCSRSSWVMGAANRGAASKQTISINVIQCGSVQVWSVFIVKVMAMVIPDTPVGRRPGGKVITRRMTNDCQKKTFEDRAGRVCWLRRQGFQILDCDRAADQLSCGSSIANE